MRITSRGRAPEHTGAETANIPAIGLSAYSGATSAGMMSMAYSTGVANSHSCMTNVMT